MLRFATLAFVATMFVGCASSTGSSDQGYNQLSGDAQSATDAGSNAGNDTATQVDHGTVPPVVKCDKLPPNPAEIDGTYSAKIIPPEPAYTVTADSKACTITALRPDYDGTPNAGGVKNWKFFKVQATTLEILEEDGSLSFTLTKDK